MLPGKDDDEADAQWFPDGQKIIFGRIRFEVVIDLKDMRR